METSLLQQYGPKVAQTEATIASKIGCDLPKHPGDLTLKEVQESVTFAVGSAFAALAFTFTLIAFASLNPAFLLPAALSALGTAAAVAYDLFFLDGRPDLGEECTHNKYTQLFEKMPFDKIIEQLYRDHISVSDVVNYRLLNKAATPKEYAAFAVMGEVYMRRYQSLMDKPYDLRAYFDKTQFAEITSAFEELKVRTIVAEKPPEYTASPQQMVVPEGYVLVPAPTYHMS